MKVSHLFHTGARVLGYRLVRRFGWPVPMPINISIVPTGRCNSRCKTCSLWKTPVKGELSVDEWDMIFKSIGKIHPWITLSEGEPFLTKDLVDIVRSAVRNNEPQIIVIPTNGILTEKIERDLKQILCFYKERLIVNLSLDDIGDRHDRIRGIKGNFDRLLRSISVVKKLKKDFTNLRVGVNTVISKYNIDHIKEISDFVGAEIGPDSHIFEIAENRKSLNNINMNMKPDANSCVSVIHELIKKSNGRDLTHFFRKRYYRLISELLENQKEIIPCYAGIGSAHISSTGEVLACCSMYESMGNLRKGGYNFKELWKSEKARMVREKIKKRHCWCTHANNNYSNILCSHRLFLG